jgi:hypothetical protein
VQANGNLELDLSMEAKVGKNVTERSQARLIARSGQTCVMSLGKVMVGLTPTLKVE